MYKCSLSFSFVTYASLSIRIRTITVSRVGPLFDDENYDNNNDNHHDNDDDDNDDGECDDGNK
jgi:hypothetical protein